MTIKMYKCNSCSYSNKNAGTLFHHKKTHDPGQIPCDVCSKVFISRSYMQGHKSKMHETMECQICSKMVKKGHMQAHTVKHTGYLYRCPLCPKSYMDQASLFHHNKTHYPDNAKCIECSQMFNNKQDMTKHFKRAHTKVETFSCDICQKIVHTSGGLKSHIILVHSTEGSISCDQCPKLFQTQSLQRRHSKKAHNLKKITFPCYQCNKEYTSETGIKDHMTRIHANELNFQCKYCDKRFKVARVLKKHMNDLHVQPFTPISCNVCGKTSFSQFAQKQHARVHIESARVKCEMCPRMFKPAGLASHAKSHELHLVTCGICNKQVKSQSSLNKHKKRFHIAQIKREQCGMCKKRFSSSKDVQAHQLTHTTEKPFKCQFPNCSKSYNNGGSKHKHVANYHKPLDG